MAILILEFVPGVTVEDITVPDAPSLGEGLLRFFVHPQDDLEELRRSLVNP